MTFVTFCKLLETKYPKANAFSHGDFGGNEKNRKVTIEFEPPHGKTYDYYGAYEDVLCKCGIPTITHERFDPMCERLERFKRENGTADDFFGIPIDYTKEIEELETRIADIKANYYIV